MLSEFLNKEYCDPSKLSAQYQHNNPFPHIVMPNFLHSEILDQVLAEFPNLKDADVDKRVIFGNEREIKFASKGIDLISPAAFKLISFLNSEWFLRYLQEITGIKETLIADPYLAGGGYHQIFRGGLLKIHADFNKHPSINFDRRLNLLLYLNKDWDEEWGGDLQLFDESMQKPIQRVYPHFNTCVVFTTTSKTYHGHPDPIQCPDSVSRRSIALYYFSVGRPKEESNKEHSTLFKAREDETFAPERKDYRIIKAAKNTVKTFAPPAVVATIKKILKR